MIVWLSKIMKELAQEFRMPEKIEKHLYKKIFLLDSNKKETLSEKNEDGTNND